MAESGQTRWLTAFDSYPDPTVHECEVVLRAGDGIRPDAARLVRTRPGWKGNPNATQDGVPGLAMNWLEVEGPLHEEWPPASYQALFGTMPFKVSNGRVTVISKQPRDDAKRLLEAFISRAYRGHAGPPDALTTYLAIFDKGVELGYDFTRAMIAAYTAVLCSPDFLFITSPPGELDQPALAARLAYFLWNGPPDEALLSAKDLTTDAELRRQTERLLGDTKSDLFVNAFLDYWLDLRNINETAPDAELYPDYYLDSMLVESALLETRLFVRSLIDENKPARTLVDADYTFINERLAQHYGLPPEQTVALKRTQLPADSPRGGLLTQASVLKVTANGTTTSPVLRGVWIAERLLGIHIAPPPSGVEAIEPDTRGAVTIRAQLAKHKSTASCAACHSKFDPFGFALESFDVLGGWRDKYRANGTDGERVAGIGKNGHEFQFTLAQPVECEGQLRDGRTFADIFALKRLLLSDERAIARNIVNRLVVYSTGKPVSFADRQVVEEILDQTAATDFRVRDLIHGVIQSRLFRGM